MIPVLDPDIVICEHLIKQLEGSGSDRLGGYGDLEHIPSACGKQSVLVLGNKYMGQLSSPMLIICLGRFRFVATYL